MIKLGLADKVYTLVPHVATDKIVTAGDKVARPRGRPHKFQIQSFNLSPKQGQSAQQQSENPSQPYSGIDLCLFSLLRYIKTVKRFLIRRVWDEGQNFSCSQYLGAPPAFTTFSEGDGRSDRRRTNRNTSWQQGSGISLSAFLPSSNRRSMMFFYFSINTCISGSKDSCCTGNNDSYSTNTA